METQQNLERQKLKLSLATILAIVAIVAGLLTSLMNLGVIDVSQRNDENTQVVQWEQINAQTLHQAMRVWKQITEGANMATLAKTSSLQYTVIDGRNPPKKLDVIRDQIQEIETGGTGPIVQIGDQFCVARVTKRNDDQ